MRQKKYRIRILIFIWLLLSIVSGAMARDDKQKAVDRFIKGGVADSSSVSVLILDLEDGKVLGSHNAAKPLIPASVMKCVTTATLLEETGEEWQYETPVYITGKIRDNVLEGNVIVEGAGDPSINTSHEPKSQNLVDEIVNSLRNRGINKIEGRIKIDEHRFAGPSVNPEWAKGDLPHSYGTGTHGFNFEDNASGKRSVQDPGGVFLTRLGAALARAGIEVGNQDISDKHKQELGMHRSATIDEIMRSCMMRSDNQFAEALLRTVSSAKGGDGSVADGARREMSYWKHKNLPMEDIRIVDGSGLSRGNRMTANFLGSVLKEMSTNPYYASFFPLAGQEGTLRRFLAGTPLEGYVAMKTGSMNGIQCYAGYKLDDDYAPTHVIVVMINNMRNRGTAREGVRKMLETIFLGSASENSVEEE